MLTKGFIRFNAGVFRSPMREKLWLLVLLAANLIAPLWFFERLEALFVLAAMFLSMILMNFLTGLQGFTRLLGLGHIAWGPLVVWLCTRLDEAPGDTSFGVWLRLVIVVNTISLVIDTIDVIRYIRGERQELVRTV